MAVITQNYDIDLKSTGEYPVVKMSQFDTGSRTIVFTVYDGHELANIDGMVARVDGTRSDGVEFSSTCTVGTGSKVSFTISQEMTKHAGKHAAELVIFDASGNPAGTQNFLIEVEAAPMVRDSAASADDRTLYDQYTDSVEQKFSSLSSALNAKADALTKTVQDIDALLGGSSKQATIFDVTVDASTTGTGITGTALGHAEYNPITGLVTFVAKTVDGLSGVKGAKQFELGTIPAKYLPEDGLFKSAGWYDNKSSVYLVGYDRIDDEGYGAESYISKDGKVYASFVYPATSTGDENAYRPVFYAQWYARGGKFIGVTPMTGGNTLTIGKTTTGEPGTQASVVNSGTAKDVVLDFTIPRGAGGTGGSYVLPPATTRTLGGVKIGSGINVASDGTISASGGSGSLSVEEYILSDWSVTADGVKIGYAIDDVDGSPVGNPSLLFYKYGERLYAETMYFYLRTTSTVVNGQVFSFTYSKTGSAVDYSAFDQNSLVGVAIFGEDGQDGVGTPLAPGYVTLVFEPKDEGSLVWGKVAVWLASPQLKPNTTYDVYFSVSGLIHAADTNS